jgi:flagellar biosynthesis/type III secretory pathway chaperone
MSPIDKRIANALKGAPTLVTATVALMEELVRVLTAEIDVVTHRRMKEHPELLKYKQRLAMDYRANMKSIAAQPDMLKKLSDTAKDALREMAQRLAVAVDENARMLRAAVSATRQLIQNIMSMVRSEAIPKNTYKNFARSHLELGTYSPTCVPVAVRRSV